MIVNAQTRKKKRKKPRIMCRMVNGALVPADRWAEEELSRKCIKDGDLVGVDISKLRSPGFNRLVHKIGALCVLNIEDFKYTDAHGAIKRLQLEGNVACEETAIHLPGFGMAFHRVPLSIAFDSMDETEYQEAAKALCSFIAEKYWPGMGYEQIALMAEIMVEQT